MSFPVFVCIFRAFSEKANKEDTTNSKDSNNNFFCIIYVLIKRRATVPTLV